MRAKHGFHQRVARWWGINRLRLIAGAMGAGLILLAVLLWAAPSIRVIYGPTQTPIILRLPVPKTCEEVQDEANVICAASDPGDFVGLGKTYIRRPTAQYPFLASLVLYGKGIEIRAGSWSLAFAAAGSKLVANFYDDAVRFPFGTKQNEMDITTTDTHNGCNVLSGRFQIMKLYTDFGGQVVKELKVIFVQHCENNSAALRGVLTFTAPEETT